MRRGKSWCSYSSLNPQGFQVSKGEDKKREAVAVMVGVTHFKENQGLNFQLVTIYNLIYNTSIS